MRCTMHSSQTPQANLGPLPVVCVRATFPQSIHHDVRLYGVRNLTGLCCLFCAVMLCLSLQISSHTSAETSSTPGALGAASSRIWLCQHARTAARTWANAPRCSGVRQCGTNPCRSRAHSGSSIPAACSTAPMCRCLGAKGWSCVLSLWCALLAAPLPVHPARFRVSVWRLRPDVIAAKVSHRVSVLKPHRSRSLAQLAGGVVVLAA
jgi:hypothetical protein